MCMQQPRAQSKSFRWYIIISSLHRFWQFNVYFSVSNQIVPVPNPTPLLNPNPLGCFSNNKLAVAFYCSMENNLRLSKTRYLEGLQFHISTPGAINVYLTTSIQPLPRFLLVQTKQKILKNKVTSSDGTRAKLKKKLFPRREKCEHPMHQQWYQKQRVY